MTNETEFAQASSAYDRGDFRWSFELFLNLAEHGDADAMSMVSTMYGNGEGVPFDLNQSLMWGQRAAAHGSTSALLNLGISYRARGDVRVAKSWFEKALEKGDGEAALELAKLYLISDFETERVRRYLTAAIALNNLSAMSLDETLSLMEELRRPEE